MTTRRLFMNLPALGAAALACLALVACGSSSKTASSGASSSPSTTSSAGSSSTKVGIANAQKNLAGLDKAPTSIGITTPLPKSPKGKTVDYIECGVSDCQLIGTELQQALPALGINLKVIDAGNTPESYGAAFTQAVDNKPDAVMVGGIGKALWAKQFAALTAANIPVIAWGTSDKPGGAIKVTLAGAVWSQLMGKRGADWEIVNSQGKAKILYVDVPLLSFTKAFKLGFSQELAQNCPGCSVDYLDVSSDDIGTKVPSQVVSYLQAHPDTTDVYVPFGALYTGVDAALRAAGLSGKVTLFSNDGVQANYAAVKGGQEKASFAFSDYYLAWVAADAVGRQLTGQDPAVIDSDLKLPWTQLVTAKTVTWDPSSSPTWPFFTGFQEQFKKLWAK